MRFSLKTGFILYALVAATSVSAEVQFDQPRVWKRARTIPASQQVWGFQTSYSNTTDRFDANGKSQPMGRPFGRSVTWKQLLDNETDVQSRDRIAGYMRQLGASEKDVAANAAYDVSREDIGFRMNWAYGLMKRWMIGFDVPLTYRRTHVKNKVNLANNSGDAEMAEKVRRASEQELANSGFDNIPDQTDSWDWGDISLLSQFAVVERYRWQWSMQQVLKFPTARNADVDNYLESRDDSGQVDLGASTLLDYRLRRWTLGGQLGYMVQMPDQVRTRVSSSSQARQVDPKTARDLGDYYWASADSEYHVTPKFNVNLEYSYLRKYRDRYPGESADGVAYSGFGQDTEQQMHQTRLGLQYRLGYAGARGGIDNKWVAMMGYTYPWIGTNSLNASKTSVDLISYF